MLKEWVVQYCFINESSATGNLTWTSMEHQSWGLRYFGIGLEFEFSVGTQGAKIFEMWCSDQQQNNTFGDVVSWETQEVIFSSYCIKTKTK